MLIVRASVKSSRLHGLGCFTNEDIKKGQVVWRFDERIDIRLPFSKLQSLPQPVQEFLHVYGYTEMYAGEKTIVLCGDHAKHMNHSSNPNLLEAGDPLGSNVAARDIKAGEELTCDYYAFDMDAAERKWE
jgi:SET domain-containing protein